MSKLGYSYINPKMVPFEEVVNSTTMQYKNYDLAISENTIHSYAGIYVGCPADSCATGGPRPCNVTAPPYTIFICPSSTLPGW